MDKITGGRRLNKQRILSTASPRQIRSLEITQAYVLYKQRHAGDLGSELMFWTDNISHFIKIQKNKR